MNLLPRMLWESNEEHRAAEPDIAEKVFQEIQVLSPYAKKKDTKIVTNRFLSYLGNGSKEASCDARKAFGYLSCCIEQNYLGNSKATQALCN